MYDNCFRLFAKSNYKTKQDTINLSVVQCIKPYNFKLLQYAIKAQKLNNAVSNIKRWWYLYQVVFETT